MLTKLHTNPSKFFLGRPKKILEGFVWSFLALFTLRITQFDVFVLNFYQSFPGLAPLFLTIFRVLESLALSTEFMSVDSFYVK